MLTSDQWHQVTSLVGSQIGGNVLLGTAMAAVGLSTSASALSGVGMKPFIVGGATALCVGSTGFLMASVLV